MTGTMDKTVTDSVNEKDTDTGHVGPNDIADAFSSSLHLTTRTNRTIPTLLLHLFLRPLHPIIAREGKPAPAGSQKLKVPKSIKARCTVTERQVEGLWIYDLDSQPGVTNPHKKTRVDDFTTSEHASLEKDRRRIYFFAGGGWASPPEPQHWKLAAHLARHLPNTVVSVVSYPLAPKSPAPTAFPALMQWYRTALADARQARERVVMMGDSAGGNIVLALTLAMLEEDINAPHPVAVFATCPSTDLSRNNPDIQKLAKYDPVLDPKFTKMTAERWRDSWAVDDPRISPSCADTSLFKKAGIKVHGITAGYDILSPDGVILRNRIDREGTTGEWLHWDKQMHVFCLTWCYGLPEAKKAVDWMIGVLKKT